MKIPTTTKRRNVGTCPACRSFLWAEVDIEVSVSEPEFTGECKCVVYATPRFTGMRVTHTCARDENDEWVTTP